MENCQEEPQINNQTGTRYQSFEDFFLISVSEDCVICFNVKKSVINNREDLIKEVRAYVKKNTGRNQDLSIERLKTESLSDIKRHLKFYRDNNNL